MGLGFRDWVSVEREMVGGGLLRILIGEGEGERGDVKRGKEGWLDRGERQ